MGAIDEFHTYMAENEEIFYRRTIMWLLKCPT
jgi:hypothetical protein